MRVLITGATGLVGQEIVKCCHENKIQVNYLTTNKSKIQNTENYQGFYWNPKIKEIDSNCFKSVDAIIHLAGASVAKRWTPIYKDKILQSRIESTILCDATSEIKALGTQDCIQFNYSATYLVFMAIVSTSVSES